VVTGNYRARSWRSGLLARPTACSWRSAPSGSSPAKLLARSSAIKGILRNAHGTPDSKGIMRDEEKADPPMWRRRLSFPGRRWRRCHTDWPVGNARSALNRSNKFC